MKKSLLITAAFSFAISPFAFAEGKDVDLKSTPEALQQVVANSLKGGKVDDVELVTHDGKSFYKVDIDQKVENGKDRDITLMFSESGELLRTKEDIKFEELPEAVQNAAKALKDSEGKVDDVNKITKGDKVSYLLEFDNDKKHLFSEDGQKVEYKKDKGSASKE